MILIKTASELEDFFALARYGEVMRGVLVSAKIRRECMLSVNQNRINRIGRNCSIRWDNLHGGVWRAWLAKEDVAHELT